jgi:KUP system potassium uptake protein
MGLTGNKGRAGLAITALGIVFGDIGTSPLYALRECFAPERGVVATEGTILGILSLLLWTLTLIVCVKYVLFVLRFDNRGEGGILALVSLAGRALPPGSRRGAAVITTLGILGAALLYSDGLITPAISVLSAVEGLRDFSPGLEPYILPISLAVLVLLFPLQSKGTAAVGRFFGPVVVVWFLALAGLGIRAIISAPQVLASINPGRALAFIIHDPATASRILGSVFLAVTGAEVLYADLGHFGPRAIRQAWFVLVFPALLLNYLGQGAWLLVHPTEVDNLFFRIVPAGLGLPMVALATAATVIASQAVISGAFSLARQSVQLGLWPRIQVRHTSSDTEGQVYAPLVNWFLLLGTVGLVLGFKKSGNLASAYGIAVSMTMMMTSALLVFLVLRQSRRSRLWLLPLLVAFLAIELAFVVANLAKIASGGWIVAAIACLLFVLMKTWIDGRNLFAAKMLKFRLAPEVLAESVALNPPARIHGTAVFMTGNPDAVPRSLLHSLKHFRSLHARVILLTVRTTGEARASEEERGDVHKLAAGIWQATLNFGFAESPNVPRHLRSLAIPGFDPHAMDTTWFVGKETISLKPRDGMSWLRKRLFAFMFANALTPADYYSLPVDRIVELGGRTEF